MGPRPAPRRADHPGRPRPAALRGGHALQPGQRPGRGHGHGRPDLARRHPGPLHEHPDRGRAARHHPARPHRRRPDRRRHRRRSHRQPAARGAQGVPGQEGEVRGLPRRDAPGGRVEVGHPRRRPLLPHGQHRAAGGDSARPVLRGRGRGAVPLGVHLPPPLDPADARRSTSTSTPAWPGKWLPHPGLHPDDRHRRRQEPAASCRSRKSPTRLWGCGPSASRSSTGSCSGSRCGPSCGPAPRAMSG